MVEMRHEEIQELLGAFALDAVEGDEAEQVELHLRECGKCRAEVADHREVATFLAHAGTSAPDGIWDRIAAEIETGSGSAPPPLQLLSAPRTGPSPRVWQSAFALAAAVTAILGFQLVRLDQRVDSIPTALSTKSVEQAAEAALRDPSSQRVRLSSAVGASPQVADAVLMPDGRGYLLMRGMPDLPYHQTYQLWGVSDGATVSLGVLGPSPNVAVFSAGTKVTGLAVTVEKAGGVVSSGQVPVLVGSIEA